jgi:CRISPR-associated protein Cst2
MTGLTATIVFQGDSLNYGETVQNISELKKFHRGNGDVHTFVSRQALRYDIVRIGGDRYGWHLDTVGREESKDEKNKTVIQYRPEVTIADSEEMDLFGYMKTAKGGNGNKRPAPVRLSHGISLETYKGEIEFLNNMGHAARLGQNPNIANHERHTSLYAYTVSIDMKRIGVDGDVILPHKERAKRVSELLDIVFSLHRNIRGRQEELSPLFVIGGLYDMHQPYFLGRTQLRPASRQYELHTAMLAETLERRYGKHAIGAHTHMGLLSGVFHNEGELRELLPSEQVHTVQGMLDVLQAAVEGYYE